MKKLILLLLFISISLISCDKLQHSFSHSSILSESDKIIIKPGEPNSNRLKAAEDSSSTKKKKYEIDTKDELKKFNNLFDIAKQTNYCCCPETNYEIAFYSNELIYETYYVDTTQSTKDVRIFQGGYQYSFIIQKQEWKKFLDEIEKKK